MVDVGVAVAEQHYCCPCQSSRERCGLENRSINFQPPKTYRSVRRSGGLQRMEKRNDNNPWGFLCRRVGVCKYRRAFHFGPPAATAATHER